MTLANTKPPLTSYLKLHFVIIIWGFTAILGMMIEVSAVALVFYRTAITALILAIFIRGREKSVRVPNKFLFKLLGIGALLALHWILFFASARISTASVSLAGMSTASLWTSFLEPIVHGRPIQRRDVFFGLLGVIGLFIIFRFEFVYIDGLIVSLLGAATASVFVVCNSMVARQNDASVITFYEMLGAAGFSALFLAGYQIWQGYGFFYQLIPSTSDWLWLVVLAAVCTAYPYTLSVSLMKEFSAFMMNFTVNLEPIYGIALAVLVLGSKEKMTTGFYIGTAIILLSVLLYPFWVRMERKKRMRITPSP